MTGFGFEQFACQREIAARPIDQDCVTANMSMTLQMFVETDVLHVTATGEFSLPDAKRTFIEVMDAVAQHQVNKVFLDGRGIEGNPEFIERFYFSEFAAGTVNDYATRGLCRFPTFAYVLKEPVLDPARFGETVAVNRGMRVKAFDNIPEARAWLGFPPAKGTV